MNWPFLLSPPRRASRRRCVLQAELLEARNLMTASVVNHLEQVHADATGLVIDPNSQPPDDSGSVLVVQGTTKKDVITLRLSDPSTGSVEVLVNKEQTIFSGPFQWIVVHGRKGNDRITIDPSLTVPTLIFGGKGKDTLVGGNAEDVLVGGDGDDMLVGSQGQDLLLGGRGLDRLYAEQTTATGETHGDNMLIDDYFVGEYDLQDLTDLFDAWDSDDSDERQDSINEILAGNLIADRNRDTSYAASEDDLAVSAEVTRDEAWFSQPGISSAWFSSPSVDSNGFVVYRVRSDYQEGVTKIRVLISDELANSSEAFPVVYVLPVEASDGNFYGDGLLTVKSLGLQDQHHSLFVSPTFSRLPWYFDHSSNQRIWNETHFRTVVVPFVESQFHALTQPEGRLLLGFSKSGLGAFTMLLRHPDEFGRAFAFDAPLNWSGTWLFDDILGSDSNYRNYRLTNLLPQQAELLREQPARLFMLGYNHGYSREQHREIHNLMDRLDIPHVYDPGRNRPHRWDGEWVRIGVDLLLS